MAGSIVAALGRIRGGEVNLGDPNTFAGHMPAVVCAAGIAVLAVYVALDLAGRARHLVDRTTAMLWSAAGAAAMGTGVWSMHFVGMSAVEYPFSAGFGFPRTFLSWAIAAMVCGLPMWVAASSTLRSVGAVWGCAGALGIGAVLMHLVGASAMVTSPPPDYDILWLGAALAVATLGCGLALSILNQRRGATDSPTQFKTAAIMGGALTGMHFLAMVAASFVPGALCLTREGIEAHALSWIVGSVTLFSLGMLLLVSALEKRAQRVSSELNESLARARGELERATSIDAVTALPNRLTFQDALKRSAARSDADSAKFAVLLIDIDGFERVRRSHEPAVADQILRACAMRLAKAVGSTCHLASASAHQFLVLADLPENGGSERVLRLTARIASEMRPPFDDAMATRLTASIGISMHPADGAVPRAVANASFAMEAVKVRGGNGYAFFAPEMDSDAHAAMELLDDLRTAVDLGQLSLHYQPKIHAGSGQIAGVEALLRWRHPVRGSVGPDRFIPVAERFGLINELGAWVVAEAVRQMAEWARNGLQLRVAINVSPGQLLQTGFAESVVSSLADSGVPASLLTCEITESGAMQNAEVTMAAFKSLEAAGVQLSIDDFGTGYSSLSHLRKIPLRQLKVDRSFVKDLEASADARSIVTAIIVMAHALRLEVVAEGVETAAQRDILLAMGCDKFQGYLFAKPMPPEQLTDLMRGVDAARRQFRDSIFVP